MPSLAVEEVALHILFEDEWLLVVDKPAGCFKKAPVVRYEIRLPNEEIVIAVKPTLSGELMKTGEKVKVFMPVEYTRVFAYPDTGLKEELSVA